MEVRELRVLETIFVQVEDEDPRVERTKRHGLYDILIIENSLHWVIDFAFREDESHVRQGEATENLAVLGNISLNLLRQKKSSRVGIHANRLKAGWDNNYLLSVLEGVN